MYLVEVLRPSYTGASLTPSHTNLHAHTPILKHSTSQEKVPHSFWQNHALHSPGFTFVAITVGSDRICQCCVSKLPQRADIASSGAPADEGDSSFVSVTTGVEAQNYVFPSDPSILYNNSPFVTDPTGGAGGFGLSVVEQPALNTFGWNVDRDERATLADDFNVTDSAGWQIGAFTFYTYQTNSGSTDSTLNDVNVRIWNGPPGLDGSRIIWGDVCTNLFNGSSWTGVFRALQSQPLNTAPLIMTLEVRNCITVYL